MVTCTSIGATVRHDILLIYSALYPEDNWVEAAHAWVFVVKFRGMREGSFVSTKIYLVTFPADTLKAS